MSAPAFFRTDGWVVIEDETAVSLVHHLALAIAEY
jgi:hypothetical protein